MQITKAAFLKTTLLDYPEKLACTIFLPGCNLRCPFCHNKSLVLGEEENLFPIEEIIQYIHKRKNILQGVCISGGEPLIYDNLPDLAREIRSAGVKSIKIDTNGILTEKLFDANPDYIAMDIKTVPEKYSKLLGDAPNNPDIAARITSSIEKIMTSSITYEFRTTLVPGIIEHKDMEKIAYLIKGCAKYTLNKFSANNTLDKNYSKITPYSEEEYETFLEILRQFKIPAFFRGV
ncbi:MAG: anaerobic ribonucleoside-triphosphate reductase activating protein [Spirochaetes bacterium]|nr:anaerobic ribonucleoside-triphosphate reductase activating protein [Spirochaetota bacterium]